MNLTALDILVIIAVVGSGVLGFMRGFVTEVLSLVAWVGIVIALKLFHAPVAGALAPTIGTAAGAGVLAFAIVAGMAYFGGRLIANAVGRRLRSSVLGPLDRALGFGFGMLKGLIFVSLAFLLVVLVVDTMGGGRDQRPAWMTGSRTYPTLDATSAKIGDFVDRRRRGEKLFGTDADNAADAARARAAADTDNMIAAERRTSR